jgi:6-phosphogluconolactonase
VSGVLLNFTASPPPPFPRHLAFHPTLSVAYVLNELDNTLGVFTLDAATGGLKLLQNAGSTIPADYDEPPPFDFYTASSHAAGIVVSPDGRWVLCTNRGHDSVVTFAVDADKGTVASPSTESFTLTEGALPWHCDFISPDKLAVTTQVRAAEGLRLLILCCACCALSPTPSLLSVPFHCSLRKI